MTDSLTIVMPHYVRSKGEFNGFCVKYRQKSHVN